MSADRVTTDSEIVPTLWTELDDRFFTLVGDVLSTNFLWGAATLLASYDADDTSANTAQRQTRPSPSLPSQRSLAA